MKYDIYLSPPHMGENEIKYIQEAFDTNWIAPAGANIGLFEKALEDFTGVKSALVLNSGTAAIHLALIVLGVQSGDEVLAPTLTFGATINPILYLGAKPILIDSEKETWNMCPHALRTAIEDRIAKGKKPKAIMVVHLYGMPAKMKEIIAISEEFDIPIIEDAAEALGSSYKNQPLGNVGKIGIISFNGNKILTTSAGGAFLSNDLELVEHAKLLATGAREFIPHYNYLEVGYNYRMSNILAGIGRGQMEVLPKRVAARRANFSFYKKHLNDIEGVSFHEEPNDYFYSCFWLSVMLLDKNVFGENKKEEVRLALMENKIESRPVWTPLHMNKIYSELPFYGGRIAEDIFEEGLCLPSGSALTVEQKERVVEIIRDNLFTN